MPSGAQAGAAYITVSASMDKSFSSDISSSLGDAGDEGGGLFSSGLLESVKGLAGPVIAAIGVAEITKAIADIGKQALDAYADYEQLSGGVDKLFGEDAAESVKANAQAAFESAGLSANEYMETVTTFSASLIKSLDGDTSKAAEQADKAIRDMSDNVNTFGGDMDSLQATYKNFARGQFQMLDNLSLGYNGSKEGMEQLLADAEAISGVHYDINNYSDIIDAIHEIQDAQHIAGTTANEAAGTVSGATASMKAAWANWLTELGKSDADMAAVSQQLGETAMNVAKNVLTVIGNIIKNAVLGFPSIAQGLGQAILNAIGWDAFAQKSMQVWADLRAKIDAKLLEIENAARDKFNAMKTSISTTVDGIKNKIQVVWNVIKTNISTTVDNIKSKLLSGFSGIRDTVSSTFESIKTAIFSPIETAYNKVKGFIDDIKGVLNTTLDFPHIKVPHFHISGGEIPWGIGGKGTAPSVSVEWYAQGGMVSDATLIGAGEKGAELIWPSYDPYMEKYAKAIAKHMPNGGVTVTGNTFIVRKESDIQAIGRAINDDARRREWARL